MSSSTPKKSVYTELDVQKAISAVKKRQYSSIRTAAAAFNIPNTMLRNRMSGRNSRATAHESEQLLSNVEEKTLVRWITRLTRTGFPAYPALAL